MMWDRECGSNDKGKRGWFSYAVMCGGCKNDSYAWWCNEYHQRSE